MTRRGFLTATATALAAPARRVAVIAHRGEHRQHPENTLPALSAAIDAGANYVEVDVRTTRDGALVLLHDSTVDARTDGTGPVGEKTLAEVRSLDAGIRFSARFAGTRVPLFDEALRLLRGKCGLYLDWKQAEAGALLEALRRHNMVDRTVVYGGRAGLRELHRLEPAVRVMPEAESVALLRDALEELKPEVIAFDRRDFQDEILAVAKAARVEIFVDRLGADDTAPAWEDAVLRGATGIQTDRPAELAEFLRRKGWR